MMSFGALRDCIRTARAALVETSGGFEALFGWIAHRIAAQAGLDPRQPLPGFETPPPGLPAGLQNRLEQAAASGAWDQEESLGWAYQFWNAPRKQEAFRRLYRQRQKISVGDLPAATQLFTPRWLADFLVQNSLGRLWFEMHPDSRLGAGMPMLVPNPGGAARSPRPLREITLFDPACGTMHFGLAALPLLEAMYREEQQCAGQPGWPAEPSLAPGAHPASAALAHNLYGADIDPLALRLARAALAIRAARGSGSTSGLPAAHLILLPLPWGSLRREAGEEHFDCVVTNPPYMIARNMPPELAAFLRDAYPDGRHDLYAAFILRALERVRPGGFASLLTQQSFLHLRSFRGLRARVLEQASLEAVAQIGPGAFPGMAGEKINPAAFVLRRAPRADGQTACIRAERLKGAAAKQAAVEHAAGLLRRGQPDGERACWRAQATFCDPSGQPWVLWAPPGVLLALRSLPTPREMPGTDGHKTGDNARFIRARRDLTPEDALDGRWRTLARPAQQVPYRQQYDQVVDWSPEARAFYHANRASSPLPEALAGLPGICWSRVATRRFTARRFPAGVIPDVSTPAIFPPEEDSAYLVALLNSRPARCLLRALNPTINYALGDVRRLPLPPAAPEQKRAMAALALQAEAAAAGWDGPNGAAAHALAEVEAQIDRVAYALYGFLEEEITWIENEIQP